MATAGQWAEQTFPAYPAPKAAVGGAAGWMERATLSGPTIISALEILAKNDAELFVAVQKEPEALAHLRESD